MAIDDVEDLTPRKQYIAAAGEKDFDYPFPIFEDADLVVVVNAVTLALNTDYTVSGAGNDTGGTVSFLLGRNANDVVTIFRDIAIERTTDFQQNGPWTSVAINEELDRMTLVEQQLELAIGRAIRVPVSAAVADSDLQLTVADWSGKILSFDGVGKPVPTTLLTGTALTQGIFNGFLGNSQIATSINGSPIFTGDALVTPDDLAGTSGLQLPFAATGDSGDVFVISRTLDSAGSAIQGRLTSGSFLNCAGVLGFTDGTQFASVYAASFNSQFKAYLADGPSLFRYAGGDTILATTDIAGTGTAIQGRLINGGTSKTAGILGYNDNVGNVHTALYLQSFDTASYKAVYSAAGDWFITAGKVLMDNSALTIGDSFKVLNGGVGTCFQGQQAAGGHGVLGYNDGVKNAGVYGDDNGNATNYAAYFSGKGFVASAWTVSDKRLKRNIVPVISALETIKALNIVEYDKLAIPTEEHPQERVLVHEAGILAQELQTLMPSAVHDDGQWLTVNDREVLYRLVRAVQELAAKVTK